MASHLSLAVTRLLDSAAVVHKPLWAAGLLAGGLHAALLGTAERMGGPSRDQAPTPTAMHVREVLAIPTPDFLALRTTAPMPAAALAPASPIEAHHTERVAPTRSQRPASPLPDSQGAESPAVLAKTPDDAPGRTQPDLTPAAPGLRTFIAAEHLDWQPLPFSAPDTRMLDNIGASGLALKARLLINAQGVVEDLVPLQPVLAQDERWFAQLRTMFLQTQFTPGRRDGRSVAAQLDLEISTEIGAELDEPARDAR